MCNTIDQVSKQSKQQFIFNNDNTNYTVPIYTMVRYIPYLFTLILYNLVFTFLRLKVYIILILKLSIYLYYVFRLKI